MKGPEPKRDLGTSRRLSAQESREDCPIGCQDSHGLMGSGEGERQDIGCPGSLTSQLAPPITKSPEREGGRGFCLFLFMFWEQCAPGKESSSVDKCPLLTVVWWTGAHGDGW